MIEWLLVAPVMVWGYSAGARLYLRRVRKFPQADRLESLENWSTHPLSPVRLEARILHAEALRETNSAAALDVLRPAMEEKGIKAVPALLLAGRWADYDKWHGHADEHYRNALARLSGAKHALLRGRIHRFRAESALAAGGSTGALTHLSAALDENAFDQESRLLHASIAFGVGRLDAAALDFDFFETHFGNPALRARAAVCATHVDVLRRDYEAARGRLQKVRKDLPAHATTLDLRAAVVEAFSGEPARARALLEASGADVAQKAYAEGVVFVAEGNWDTAQRRLTETLLRGATIDPFAAEALWVLEDVLKRAGRGEQALEIRNRLRERWPQSPYLSSSPSEAASRR